ncbi:MAG: hypothetical protein J5634_02985 [Bacilli bacterium]|nr:hypothetical protein [Bacilli bacterium]
MKNEYQKLKNDYINYVLFFKSGNFYVSFFKDAEVLKKLFDYKIINDRVGFPLSSLNKVLNKLDNEKINYIFIEGQEIANKKEFKANRYQELLRKIDKENYHNLLNKTLLDRIEYLINYDNSNYDKIRKFIDEL